MNYFDYIRKEIIPAFGCTEPIALAYAAAKSTEVLGVKPEKIIAKLSGNIIKNANSVTVPGTNQRRGIAISLVAGAFWGTAEKKLQVLETVKKDSLWEADKFIEEGNVELQLMPGVPNLYIEVTTMAGMEKATVTIENSHTNITRIEKNDECLYNLPAIHEAETKLDVSFQSIYEFSKTADYTEIKDILDMEIQYNMSIATEGIEHEWGSNIGKLIIQNYPDNTNETIIAHAAAGSDARMSGCEKPVMINSGSGNQGITISVPIIMYAREHNYSEDILYRGLLFANLIGLYQKMGIGKLSAYCGAVSAASASIAGISFMNGDSEDLIKETIANSLAVSSGMLCDGAKASCAMKIASSLRTAFLAYQQAKAHWSFNSGDGILKENIDKTISTIGRIAREGMKITDTIILEEMIAGV